MIADIVTSTHQALAAEKQAKEAAEAALLKLMNWRMDQLQPFVDEFNTAKFWPIYTGREQFGGKYTRWDWGENNHQGSGHTRYHEPLAPLTMEMKRVTSRHDWNWVIMLVDTTKTPNAPEPRKDYVMFLSVSRDKYEPYDALHLRRNTDTYVYPDEAFVAAMELFAPYLTTK